MTYHLALALTGHGCFEPYLSRVGKVESPNCVMCHTEDEDTVEHTLMECESSRKEICKSESPTPPEGHAGGYH